MKNKSILAVLVVVAVIATNIETKSHEYNTKVNIMEMESYCDQRLTKTKIHYEEQLAQMALREEAFNYKINEMKKEFSESVEQIRVNYKQQIEKESQLRKQQDEMYMQERDALQQYQENMVKRLVEEQKEQLEQFKMQITTRNF
jgi:small-conductance mechanosensitive channel